MPRHKKKQPSDDNPSTTSLTRAQQAKVLEEKRRAAVFLAQEKRTSPAPATPLLDNSFRISLTWRIRNR